MAGFTNSSSESRVSLSPALGQDCVLESLAAEDGPCSGPLPLARTGSGFTRRSLARHPEPCCCCYQSCQPERQAALLTLIHNVVERWACHRCVRLSAHSGPSLRGNDTATGLPLRPAWPAPARRLARALSVQGICVCAWGAEGLHLHGHRQALLLMRTRSARAGRASDEPGLLIPCPAPPDEGMTLVSSHQSTPHTHQSTPRAHQGTLPPVYTTVRG